MRAAIRLPLMALLAVSTSAVADIRRADFRLLPGSGPHDVAPAPHGVIVGPDGAPLGH